VIDHVTIRVADREAARAFYDRALGLLGRSQTGDIDGFPEWDDFSIAPATAERPPTRRLHAGFRAGSRDAVDSWWNAMRETGAPDLGAPGSRPEYSPSYYGAFVADPAGNSVEAVHHANVRHDGGTIDHLWLRVRDLGASTRFYRTVAPVVGCDVETHPGRTTVRRAAPPSFTLVPGEPSEDVHLAFAAPDSATVDAFHRAGLEAGYTSLGAPGERPEYHAGYYGAFLADSDGHSIEAVFHDRAR
jgi:catechol 2,3-dioxygenase-like lactoylglutathione lyase family enzyme